MPYEITAIERHAPAAAEVMATLSSSEGVWSPRIWFIKYRKENPIAEREDGEWKIMKYSVTPFELASDGGKGK